MRCRPLRSAIGLGLVIVAASAAPASETITYTYDTQGRVVGADRAGTVNNGRSVDISYDNAGNRTNYVSDDGTSALLTISDVSATEGSPLNFTVTRSGVTSNAVSVNYASMGGTAASGSDFTAASGTLNFASGETSKPVSIATATDYYVEPAENMTVNLSSPSSGAVLADGSGVGTINNGGSPAVTFSISNTSWAENGNMQFTVKKTGTTFSTITVNYATSDGTATAGSDYTAKSGTLSFSFTDFSKTISVSITGDTIPEPDETLFVTLSSPSGGAGLTDWVGVGTINDND